MAEDMLHVFTSEISDTCLGMPQTSRVLALYFDTQCEFKAHSKKCWYFFLVSNNLSFMLDFSPEHNKRITNSPGAPLQNS